MVNTDGQAQLRTVMQSEYFSLQPLASSLSVLVYAAYVRTYVHTSLPHHPVLAPVSTPTFSQLTGRVSPLHGDLHGFVLNETVRQHINHLLASDMEYAQIWKSAERYS